jgi:hypothetical protein
MRTLLGFIGCFVFGLLTLCYVVATVVIQLLPLFVVAGAIVVICHAVSRHRSLARPVTLQPSPVVIAPPGHRWVLVPIRAELEPPRPRSYIDAMLVEGDEGG